ncbi:MAG: ABC transporter permease [Proteobacteria bacterium]|nr:ABC transporter permease [Pseudomonadota bacterium]
MEYLWQGLKTAFRLITHLDSEVVTITCISLKISISAVLCASLVGVCLGFIVGIFKFKGRSLIITFLNTLMAIPTVVVGLFAYSIISRQGPLGTFGLLFTPLAMGIGQFILAIPIIMTLTISATQSVDPRVQSTAVVLGANSFQSAIVVLKEARFAFMAAIIAGFGRVIGEVGSSMILGGNIKGYTRNIPTAIALETSKGEFGLAIALGIILLAVALTINFLLRFFQAK